MSTTTMLPTTRVLRATIQYDGTGYAGFQRQSSVPTVQGAVERAISRVTGEDVNIKGAGRTDAGVHARGQVVSFATACALPLVTLRRAIDATLPDDIVLADLDEVAEGFDARFSALSRSYEYIVYNAPVPSPFWRRYSHYVATPLDVEGMNAGLEELHGRHDFAAFGMPMEHTREGVTERGGTLRTLMQARCWAVRPFVYFSLEADAFLRHMVRQIVGTVLRVGHGRLAPADMGALLRARSIAKVGPAAPAHGLYLVQVQY